MKYLITLPTLCAALLLLYTLRLAAAEAATFPIQAELGGLNLDTTVDSLLAAQIISHQIDALPEQVIELLDKTLDCSSEESLPQRQHLRALGRQYSPDTAMALLIRCLLQKPRVAQAQALFATQLHESSPFSPATDHFLLARSEDYSIVFVPGWGYLEPGNPTGADMALPRAIIQAQGFETHLAPLDSNGSVEQNAELLANFLSRLLAGDKNIILVSASSGGPVVAHMVATQEIGSHRRLLGWLNICGVLHGSPVIDTLLFWPGSIVLRAIAFFQGWRYQHLLSLSRAQSVERFRRFSPPRQMTIINYIGTPFSGQISEHGRFFSRLLRKKGPNDGLTYITEAIAPGYTILGIGSDHFIMEDPRIKDKSRALLPVLLKLIERDRAQPR